MVTTFRTISLLEGLSYLAILGVTLGIISRDLVFPLGISHGVLFTLYLIFSLLVANKKAWPVWGWLLLFLGSLIPFAFIAIELFLQRNATRGTR